MARTTVDLDPTILKELKARAREEGKSLGALLSELAAAGLKASPRRARKKLGWKAQPMGLKVDLRDKAEVYRVLDDV